MFLSVVGLLVWSVSSAKTRHSEQSNVLAIIILACTSILRLISQVLAVNILGALALVFDIYALGHLFQVQNRTRPISPFWLAVLFGFSLSLVNILQRTVGFGLQQLSAVGVGLFLKLFFSDVHQEGIRIVLLPLGTVFPKVWGVLM